MRDPGTPEPVEDENGDTRAAEAQTFLFADLAGFTALTEAHGDAEATTIACEFADQVRALLPDFDAEEIKTIGDEVMIRVNDPETAVCLGLRIVEQLAVPGSPPVRVGMHSGPAVGREGDWFGGTVNLAARVAGVARAGEVLLTEETLRQSGESDRFALEERGSRRFRHVVNPVAVYRAVGPGGTGHHLDLLPFPSPEPGLIGIDPTRGNLLEEHRGAIDSFVRQLVDQLMKLSLGHGLNSRMQRGGLVRGA